jgi:hypothetical protein
MNDQKPNSHLSQSAQTNRGNVKQVGGNNVEQKSINILFPIFLILGGLGCFAFSVGRNQWHAEPSVSPTAANIK